MNGGATVSPLWTPNPCACGHDYVAHDVTVTPNRCSLCKAVGATLNAHAFQAADEIATAAAASFPQIVPPGFVSPGGFGFSFKAGTAAAGNAPGATSVTFATAGQVAAVVPGMTFTSLPGSLIQQATYRVLAVAGAVVTIPPPGLLFALPSVQCLFQGAAGSTMGPALSPNGQRAG
jgi:hypothetical protein